MLFLLFLPVALALPLSMILERRRNTSSPGKKPYTWGYFCGLTGLMLGVLGVGFLLAAPFIETNKADRDSLIMGSVVAVFAWGIPGFFILKRRNWAWVTFSIFTLNIVLWIANFRYGSNRWSELREEAKARKTSIGESLAMVICFVPLLLFTVWVIREAAKPSKKISAVPSPEVVHPAHMKVITQPSRRTFQGRGIQYSIAVPDDWSGGEPKFDYDRVFLYKDFACLGVMAEEIAIATPQLVEEAKTKTKQTSSVPPTFSNLESVEIADRQWTSLQVDSVVDGKKISCMYHFYGGPEGTFQIVGWTPTALLPEYRSQFRQTAKTFRFPQSTVQH